MNETPNILTYRFTLEQLLTYALDIEFEAAQSYKELGDLMEQTGNTEVAKIFSKMSDIEAKHATTLQEQTSDFRLPELADWQFHWPELEAPENIHRGHLHRLMTPYQALSLALDNEKRAYEFYAGVVDESSDEQVREFAAEFAVEEEQHVAWVEEWLANIRTNH